MANCAGEAARDPEKDARKRKTLYSNLDVFPRFCHNALGYSIYRYETGEE